MKTNVHSTTRAGQASTTHTPGPWLDLGLISPFGYVIRYGAPAPNDRIAYIECYDLDEGTAEPYGPWSEESKANKRLILAAPELLEALVGLLPQTFAGTHTRAEEVAHWWREKELGNGQAKFVLAAFAAIAKATGEQP
ncbi:hypothetical protein WG922_21415 [Ramlibacter sp. AN1015]|uniref:hypothetical protein n=1 Tax=Ramlibacter sp. AN1015 TaxID=3133428 RepID=UPI0030BE5B6D